MKRREEPQEKSHKQHRAKKDKLAKKLQYKKHKQSVRNKSQADKNAQKETHDEAIGRNIHIIIKKLLKYNAASEKELPSLFETLDKGNEIDIFNIEDEYVKRKLYKLFRLFGVPRTRAKYTFKMVKKPNSTVPRWKIHTLKERVLEHIKECKDEIDNEPKGEDKESQSSEEEIEIKKSEEPQKEIIISPKPNETIENIQKTKQKSIIKKGANFLENTMKILKLEEDEGIPEELRAKERKALDELFKSKKSLKKHKEI